MNSSSDNQQELGRLLHLTRPGPVQPAARSAPSAPAAPCCRPARSKLTTAPHTACSSSGSPSPLPLGSGAAAAAAAAAARGTSGPPAPRTMQRMLCCPQGLYGRQQAQPLCKQHSGQGSSWQALGRPLWREPAQVNSRPASPALAHKRASGPSKNRQGKAGQGQGLRHSPLGAAASPPAAPSAAGGSTRTSRPGCRKGSAFLGAHTTLLSSRRSLASWRERARYSSTLPSSSIAIASLSACACGGSRKVREEPVVGGAPRCGAPPPGHHAERAPACSFGRSPGRTTAAPSPPPSSGTPVAAALVISHAHATRLGLGCALHRN